MMQIKIKFFLLGAVVLGPIFLIFLLPIRDASDKPNVDYFVVQKESKGIHCADGAIKEYDRWGKSGWMVSCKLAHGPLIAAENGHVVVRSEYVMGKVVKK